MTAVDWCTLRSPAIRRAEWTARQLLQAFPGIRLRVFCCATRDRTYDEAFRETAAGLGIEEVRCAPRSPRQNAFCERMIGSILRECLDHIIVVHESGLRRVLQSFFAYYSQLRTELSHDKDTPMHGPIQPPELGRVVRLPEVGGLQYGYQRRAALRLASNRGLLSRCRSRTRAGSDFRGLPKAAKPQPDPPNVM